MEDRLTLTVAGLDAANYITILRRYTGKAVGELRRAIAQGDPVWEFDSIEQPEQMADLLELVGDMESAGARVRVELDGEETGTDVVANLLAAHREALAQIEWENDAKYGE